jgi:hypothetical protein
MLLALVAIFGFSVIAGGCGGGGGGDSSDSGGNPNYPVNPTPEPEPDTPTPEPVTEPEFFVIEDDHVLAENIVLQPNVYPLDNSEIESYSFANESDRTIAMPPAKMNVVNAAKSYQVGDVVVAPPSTDSTYGFVAVVESVQSGANGAQVLNLRQAKIDEICEQVNLFFSLHETAASYASSAITRGADTVATWDDIWQSFVGGEYPSDLPEGATYDQLVDLTIPPDDTAALKLKALFSDMFKASTKLETHLKLTSSFALILSVEDSTAKQVAVHFPYRMELDTDLELAGGVEKELFEAETPRVAVCKGAVLIKTPKGPIPIPWDLGVSLVFRGDGGLDAGIDLNYNTILAGDYGFYWDGELHATNTPIRTVGGSGLRAEPSVNSYAEFGFGPKIDLDVCFAPFTSAKLTVGAKFEKDWGDLEDFSVDGKFKVTLTADLLELCKKWAKLFDELKFSVDIIDHPWPIFPPTRPPTTNGNWIDVADTSWYIDDLPRTYQLTSADQLAGLAKLCNEGKTFENIIIMLGANIDLAGREWTPIGGIHYNHSSSSYDGFSGEFDGGGHTISNLTITQGIEYYHYYGLFGVNNGTIKNINLTGVNIDASTLPSYYNTSSHSSYAGSIVGANSGTLTDCDASGSVSSSFASYLSHDAASIAGGIVGINGYGTLVDCDASVKVSSSSSSYYSSYSSFSILAGGIAGSNSGTLTDCDASGDVSSSSSYGSYAGGIAGSNSGTLTDCDASGNVSSSSSFSAYSSIYSSYAGGIVGYNNNVGTLTDCDASGNVSSSSSYYSYYSYAGGIVGQNYGTLTDCDASGRVTASSDNPDPSYVRAGGFAGEVRSDSNLSGNTWNKAKSGQEHAIGWDYRKDPPGPSDDI